mgnify:CR=1 FL=1
MPDPMLVSFAHQFMRRRWKTVCADAREDTADFTLAGLVRLYYKQAGRGVLSAEQEERLKFSGLHCHRTVLK